MKKLLKMMLVLSFFALALSGCNVFGNDDDKEAKVVIYEASLAGRTVSGFAKISSSTISKGGYNPQACFEYALKLKNEGDDLANGITYSVALYKDETKVSDLASNESVSTIEVGAVEPASDNSYLTSGTWSSSFTFIPDYDNGSYKMIFTVSNGQTKEVEFTITD